MPPTWVIFIHIAHIRAIGHLAYSVRAQNIQIKFGFFVIGGCHRMGAAAVATSAAASAASSPTHTTIGPRQLCRLQTTKEWLHKLNHREYTQTLTPLDCEWWITLTTMDWFYLATVIVHFIFSPPVQIVFFLFGSVRFGVAGGSIRSSPVVFVTWTSK